MENTFDLSKFQKRTVYSLIFIVPFLIGLGVDLYVPSLPQIVRYFHTKSSLVQLTVSLYMFGYGIGQVILGVLSDSFGRRKVLLLSAIFFTIVSLVCTFANILIVFEIARLLQGICVAGLAVVARAMIPDVFSGIELAKATNYFTLSWSLGPIIAPFIGGNLANIFGWRSNFYFFSVYGLFIFIYSFVKFKETNKDLVHFGLSTTAVSIKRIFTSPLFMIITTISAVGYGAIVLFNAVGPFLIEVVLKYSISEYGNFAMILGCAYCFGATTNRFVISKFKSKSLLKFGLITCLLGSMLMILLSFTFNMNLYVIIVPVFLIFFFIGFIVPNALALTMSLFSEIAGTASSIFGTITGIVVFVITMFGSSLKTDSQISLAVSYLALLIISLVLFHISNKLEKKLE